METATITLSAATTDIGQREVFVSLDGARLATLLFGETITREIPAGQHRIRAHNTLVWKTIEFTVAAGARITFRLIKRPGWGTYAMLALLGTGPLYLTFDKVDE